jgi:hypothetical protein
LIVVPPTDHPDSRAFATMINELEGALGAARTQGEELKLADRFEEGESARCTGVWRSIIWPSSAPPSAEARARSRAKASVHRLNEPGA